MSGQIAKVWLSLRAMVVVADNDLVISDANRHAHHDLPVLLAGGGNGTLKPGRHIRYEKETPMTNLFLSMLDKMQVEAGSFGDSTGRAAHLDG